ncbi:unnamed protein product [Heterobilharzia americana]|nr:unnamed protein product [Heterobilharzia americana]CAH8622341.1 unnamed protein product [Heterobilharzia americana]
MFELDRRKPLTDLQIKQRLAKLPVYEQFDFLRASDILLDKESEITLQLFANLRGHLHTALTNIKNELTSYDLEEEKEVTDENVLPFDLTTKIGQKLASIAQIFMSSIKKTETTDGSGEQRVKSAEKKDVTSDKRQVKSGRSEKNVPDIKKSRKFAKAVTSLKDSKKLAAVQSNSIPELPEYEHDRKARSYLKERLFGDLGEAAKREQEILMGKMKLQALRFTSESFRQQEIINERINEAKNRKIKKDDVVEIEAVSQLLDQNREFNEIYQRDREEHEKVLSARIQQKLQPDNRNSVKGVTENNTTQGKNSKLLENKRPKKKRPLPVLGDLDDYEANVESASTSSIPLSTEVEQKSRKKREE